MGNGHSISILGGGPAGASAAIAARLDGCSVRLIDKSKFPHHKVCGEFFSPEIAPELEKLGVWDAFICAGPARVHRMKLRFGKHEKICYFPEHAWGLSRFAFDVLLREHALSLGAELVRESKEDSPDVIAVGRVSTNVSRAGRRLFGFKTHFEGPTDDAVELFFFDGCYVGINAVEGGRTNVCGLGPEDFLRRYHFDFDAAIRQCPALAERLEPLTRSMNWLSTGPLQYGQGFDSSSGPYRAGDALSFVDPFTGSGLIAAVKTGGMAGIAAAHQEPLPAYLARCRACLKQPFEIASILRGAVDRGWAEWLAGLIPGRLLFALTRPH